MKLEGDELPYLILSEYYGMRFLNVYSLDTFRRHSKDIGMEIVSVYRVVVTDKVLSFEKVDSVEDLLAGGSVECAAKEICTND